MPVEHMHLLIKLSDDLDAGILDTIIGSDAFNGAISGNYYKYSTDVVLVSIYSNVNKQDSFENHKTNLIKRLGGIFDYISVLYDSQTATRMANISTTIYDLEREFRTLIEIIFIAKFGRTWDKQFIKDGVRYDRTQKREKVFEFLKNPLDNQDFKDLSSYAKDYISSNGIRDVYEKLLLVEQKVSEFDSKNIYQQFDLSNDILSELEQIKSMIGEKKQGFKSDEIYMHLNSTVSKEWEELYTIRNYWAHNNCLLTEAEYKNYCHLYNAVIKKIRTEITLMSYLNGQKDIIQLFDNNEIKLSLLKFNYEGTPRCKLKAKLKNQDTAYDIQKSSITYKDISQFIARILDAKNNTYEIDILDATVTYNPFLTKILKDLTPKIIETINSLTNEEFEELLKQFKELGYEIIRLTEEDDIKNDDVDDFLRKIFNT